MQVLATGWKANFGEGKEREVAIEEFAEQMKFLENELNGKDFFGGETIGFLDIVANLIAFWFPISHEVLGVEVITQEKFPVLLKWIGKLQEIDVVSQSRPPREKHVAHVRARMEGLNSGSK